MAKKKFRMRRDFFLPLAHVELAADALSLYCSALFYSIWRFWSIIDALPLPMMRSLCSASHPNPSCMNGPTHWVAAEPLLMFDPMYRCDVPLRHTHCWRCYATAWSPISSRSETYHPIALNLHPVNSSTTYPSDSSTPPSYLRPARDPSSAHQYSELPALLSIFAVKSALKSANLSSMTNYSNLHRRHLSVEHIKLNIKRIS